MRNRPICVLGAKVSNTQILLKSGGIIKVSPDTLYPRNEFRFFIIYENKIIKSFPVVR